MNNNGLLLSETTGNETLRYYYDSTGKVVSIGYQKGTAAEVLYFFARNGQGDVIAVYRNSDSKLIGTYEYDLWGRLISAKEASSGIDTNGILTKNPIRYRGYYYDSETGFYYLQSRYYDPVVRRFISADSVVASPGSSVQGHNLFGYCFNNPVNMTDEMGYWPVFLYEMARQTIIECIPVVGGICQDAVNFDINNQSEEKVLESNYFSIYKGVPVFRIDGDRSGSFGVIFITRDMQDRKKAEETVRHEYGHVKQLEKIGVVHYFWGIFIPSAGMWGNGYYYDKAFETSADIYGGVQSRTYTDAEIMYSMAYLEVCDDYGPLAWTLIGLGDIVYD